jgi:hypothetical protein
MQRQACGGTNNMTAYTYGYNVNSMISYCEAKRLSKKQTNVYEVDDTEFSQGQKCDGSIPKRNNVQGIFSSNLWPVHNASRIFYFPSYKIKVGNGHI